LAVNGYVKRNGIMSWYKIFMIIGVILVAGGWAVYLLWDYRMRKEEEKQPKQRSERLRKTQTEVSDWAKKMAEYKSPAQQRKEREQGKQT